MTFARQVWLSRVVGGSLAVLALTLTGIVALLGERWAVLLDFANTILFLAAAVGIMGGVVRPIQRWYWLRVLRPSTLYSDRYKRFLIYGVIGDRWLHLDGAGLDRDALHG